MRSILRVAVRRAARFIQRRRAPTVSDVRAVPLTPDGRIVLVRHTYIPGWYLPGGGRRHDEPPDLAILRELREEIGARSIAALEPVDPTLFIAHGVHYRPRRWSIEIAAVAAFDPDDLPADATPRTRANIARALDHLRAAGPARRHSPLPRQRDNPEQAPAGPH